METKTLEEVNRHLNYMRSLFKSRSNLWWWRTQYRRYVQPIPEVKLPPRYKEKKHNWDRDLWRK